MPKELITQDVKQAAETVLAKGYSVELKPVKDGVAVVQTIRKQIKTKSNKLPSP